VDPLYRAERTARQLGLRAVYVKDDGRNPTASFKDRASAVVVLKALAEGASVVTTASSGNATAVLGLLAVILVPHTAPPAQIAQLLIYSARVYLVEGTCDKAFDLAVAAEAFGWYCRHTAYDRFTRKGKKTAAYELWDQLGGRAPDRAFMAVGDGNILSGIWKGFRDLAALGWIDRIPVRMGVQAEGAAALAPAWARGDTDARWEPAQTIADSIAVRRPRDARFALRAVQETGGAFLTVQDEEIPQAMQTFGREVWVFAAPSAAAAFAGLKKAVREGMVGEEEVVMIATGNSLKEAPSAIRATGEAPRISAAIPEAPKRLHAAW